ncbi:MAG: flagellar export chaperone FlgN [Syntrophaceticus sp.]
MEYQHYKGKELFWMTPEGFSEWIFCQKQIVAQLLELAAKKHRILIAGIPKGQELQELNEIIQEENEMLKVLREIEKGWENQQECSSALDNPELAARFISLQDDYKKLQSLNCENRVLLICVQQYLNFSLELLCGEQSGATYRESSTRKGEVERVAYQPGKFDCQV